MSDKAAREEAERCTAHLTNVGGDYQCDLTADHYHLGHQSFAAQAIWSPIPQAAQPVVVSAAQREKFADRVQECFPTGAGGYSVIWEDCFPAVDAILAALNVTVEAETRGR